MIKGMGNSKTYLL